MKTIKVIDLLNKIANGEEVPKKVKYKTYYWEYKEERKDYKDKEDDYVFGCSRYDIPEMLDNEVEIIEEEKEIPEKINWKPKESMAGELTQKEKIEVIARRTEKLKKEFNNLLDHLKSKGDE